MKRMDIERLAYNVLDRIPSHRVEDSRIELKAELPKNAVKAARRIAAHANASRGEPVFWLIGVDEDTGVIGYLGRDGDLAEWWPQVRREFDSSAPELHDLIISYGEKSVLVLVFSTDGIPFVIKNPVRNEQGCGPVELEVPWREGTRVRSAKREELLRLLLPLQTLPEVQILGAKLALHNETPTLLTNAPHWAGTLTVFIVPKTNMSFVVAGHLSHIAVAENIDITERPVLGLITFRPESLKYGGGRDTSPNLLASRHNLIVNGPGEVCVDFGINLNLLKLDTEEVIVRLVLGLAGYDRRIIIRCTLSNEGQASKREYRLTRYETGHAMHTSVND